MTKKSFILSALLLAGLATPQETKPAGPLFAGLTAVVLFPLGIMTGIYTIKQMRYPNYVSDFLINQNQVSSYQLDIKIFETHKNGITLVEKTIQSNSPDNVITEALTLAKPYDRNRSIKIIIKINLVLNDGKIKQLTPIKRKRLCIELLREKLYQKLIIPADQLITGNNVGWLSTLFCFGYPFLFYAQHKNDY